MRTKKTVLIVDDDALARIGIKSITNFEKYGYTLIGEENNGTDALETILASRPDIVLCDVKMPGLNGVELLLECKKQGIPSTFIMLSSYDDFTFVKEALTNGASDYILKGSLEEEVIISALDKILIKGNSETPERTEKVDDSWVRSFLLSEKAPGEREKTRFFSALEFGTNPYYCLTIKLVSRAGLMFSEEELARLEIPSKNICEELRIEGSSSYFLYGRTYLIYFPVTSRLVKHERLIETMNRIAAEITKLYHYFTNARPILGLSDMHSGSNELYRAFKESEKACYHGIVESKNLTYFIHLTNEKHFQGGEEIEAGMKDLQKAIHNLSLEKITEEFENLKRSIAQSKNAPQNRIRSIGYTILFVIDKFIGLEDKEVYRTQIETISGIEDTIIWLSKLEEFLKTNLESRNGIVKRFEEARAYIAENFQKPLSLEMVAKKVGLSPTDYATPFL